jgi:hypothetical protein
VQLFSTVGRRLAVITNIKILLTYNCGFKSEYKLKNIYNFFMYRTTRDVSHYGLAIYIKKYLKPKRRIMETQIFHSAKI